MELSEDIAAVPAPTGTTAANDHHGHDDTGAGKADVLPDTTSALAREADDGPGDPPGFLDRTHPYCAANVRNLDIADIEVPAGRRAINEEKVKVLVESIGKIGMNTPLTVRMVGSRAILVTGGHRREAAKRLGWKTINCVIINGDEIEAKKWEIAENLHRAGLTELEEAEHIARWVELTTQRVSSQSETKPNRPGRPESGQRRAARELGLNKDKLNRKLKIASITDEAKQKAKQVGLDRNQNALLAVADEPPDRQVKKVIDLASAKANEKARKAAQARQETLRRIRDAVVTLASMSESTVVEMVKSEPKLAEIILDRAPRAMECLRALVEACEAASAENESAAS